MIRKILPTVLDTRCNIILTEEKALAKAVSSEVIEQNAITVWDVMIPFIFIMSVLKYRRAKEIFILNFIFTKKMALEAAVDMIRHGKSKEAVLKEIIAKTDIILASDKKGGYADKIRQKQMKEIVLLIDHYIQLIGAEGKDYDSILKNAYQTQDNYNTFLHKLVQAEKDVNRKALQIVGRSEVAYTMISKMEKATQNIRMARANGIFLKE